MATGKERPGMVMRHKKLAEAREKGKYGGLRKRPTPPKQGRGAKTGTYWGATLKKGK